jgi:uncharacterized protein (TIGR02145 family)
MKKHLIHILIGIFLLSNLYGSPVDSILAKQVARNYYIYRSKQSGKVLDPKSLKEMKLHLVQTVPPSSKGILKKKSLLPHSLFYVFNIDNDKGFMIVSGDDRVRPVLGYSFNGSFKHDDQPPAFIDWLNYYREQIQFLINNDLNAAENAREEWSVFTGSEHDTEGIFTSVNDIAPLLSTTWNQDCYYNNYCPADSRGPCDKVWAGCVAVAMAQIMKYWEYPVVCNSIPGYNDSDNQYSDGTLIPNSNYGWIPAINPTTYNWVNMPDELTYYSSSTLKDAIAWLIYHCGVAAKMNYGPYSSSGSANYARNALVDLFKYSSEAQHIYSYDYDSSEWISTIRNELDNGRPVYYTGNGPNGGHAFVCDGYQEDFFHFNWGWGGSYDGYFLLTDLTPGSRYYTDYQTAITDIHPASTFPQLEYLSHNIDDDNMNSFGNNNGRADAGESIELSVTLINKGITDANHVIAVLSCTDDCINIRDDDLSFGTIGAGLSSTKFYYDLDISTSCTEKDVMFHLEITSDEGNWTDEFGMHIYPASIGDYRISGYVYGDYGVPLQGIAMKGFPEEIFTNSEGYYECFVDSSWSGTVTPYKENYEFNPGSISYDLVLSDYSNNYNGGVIKYKITGIIAEPDGTPVENVTLTGLPFIPETNSEGQYIARVSIGFSGTAIPQKHSYTFEPCSTVYVNVTTDLTTNYIAYQNKFLGISIGENSWTFPNSSEDPMYNTFGIFSNTEWTVEKDVDWFTLSKTSGSGNDWVRVTIDSVNYSAIDRIGIITISGTGVDPVTLRVTQTGAAAYLILNAEYLSLGPNEGAGNDFTISSNTNWSINADIGWIDITPVNGSNNSTVTITSLSSNEITSGRAGIIEISGFSVDTLHIKVIQTGKTDIPPPFAEDIEVCEGDTIPALTASGTNIKWYASDQSLKITDRSGNSYKTIIIGEQFWMAENLRTLLYNDGTEIHLEEIRDNWGNLASGAYCWYNNNPDMNNIFGALYNWHAVNTGKLCPEGWHVPSNEEWNELINELGGMMNAGGNLKNTGTAYWQDPNSGATNESGFSALPGGFRDIYGDYSGAGSSGYFWATNENDIYARLKRLNYNHSEVQDLDWHKINGFSVRCIKNGSDMIAMGDSYDPGISSPGRYVYYVTQTINGIESEKTEVFLIINPKAEISLQESFVGCEGDTLSLAAGDGYSSYLWNTGEDTQSIDVYDKGTYTVKVTNSFSCEAGDQINVSFNPLPDIQIKGPSDACEGDTISLDAGEGFAVYSWNNGSVNPSIDISEGGEYIVEVADDNNCTNTAIKQVIFHPLPPVFLGNDTVIHTGDTILINAGAGFAGYLWSNGSDQESILLQDPGEGEYKYFVTVSDEYGCINSDTIIITVNLPIKIFNFEDKYGIMIYPNPAGDFLNIKTEISVRERIIIRVFSSTGNTFLLKGIEITNSAINEEIDISMLEPGVYILEIDIGKSKGYFGFIKR